MKSFIKLLCLSMMYFEISSLGINIYHQNRINPAMAIYNSFIEKGVDQGLITIIEKQSACSMTYENSFLDICIDENNEMKIIRKTSWLQKSLKPLTKR